jgi:catechol 2,3-dioxygenase-like lactoylglutathione lyase family enzyme
MFGRRRNRAQSAPQEERFDSSFLDRVVFQFMKRALLLMCALAVPAMLPAQQSNRPAITGIAFARFYTTNVAGAERFYGNILGFSGQQVGTDRIYPVNRSQWIEVTSAAPPDPNVRMAAVAFTTRDAAALQQYLKAHGVAIETPLKKGEFAVRDPEGNLVIFVQRDSNKLVAKVQPAAKATSGRIIHVGFVVNERDKEDAFWRTLLGFRPYWYGGQTDARTDYVALQVPDGTDWLEYMLNSGSNSTLQHNGMMDHFSLGIAHMSDVVAALQRNQCEGANCSKTQTGRDGKVQLNLFDPDLTRVEFMEFTPMREPCCSPFTGKHPTAEEDR